MRRFSLCALVCFILWSPMAYGRNMTGGQTKLEIAHLLDYIENSGCSFIRNGKAYPSVKAREHIQKKYDYVKKKVQSTEDFIEYAATGSSITGTSYQARCGSASIKTSEWLLQELDELRSKNSTNTLQ